MDCSASWKGVSAQIMMHPINGIMLIMCHCQPDTSVHPPTCIKWGGALMVHVVAAGGIYQLELVDMYYVT
ncbi:hypothetical protein BS78_02G182400 [Paspalum vaginatum]|nr:hypothetical protein BS78_02G182400 [Paspalum vaginatum]